MKIINKQKKDAVIIKIDGELDHHTAEEVRDQMDNVLGNPTIKHLILDMDGLVFMDSSGIGVIIGRYKTIASRKGKVCIINANPHIQKILEVSGLYKLMKEYKSLQDALESVWGEK